MGQRCGWMTVEAASEEYVFFVFVCFFEKYFLLFTLFFCAATFFLAFSMKFGGDFSVFVSHVNMIINQNKTKTYHKEISQKKILHTHTYVLWFALVFTCLCLCVVDGGFRKTLLYHFPQKNRTTKNLSQIIAPI